MKEKLESCPFCGEEDFTTSHFANRTHIRCKNCNATGPACCGDLDDTAGGYAIKAWNRRPK